VNGSWCSICTFQCISLVVSLIGTVLCAALLKYKAWTSAVAGASSGKLILLAWFTKTVPRTPQPGIDNEIAHLRQLRDILLMLLALSILSGGAILIASATGVAQGLISLEALAQPLLIVVLECVIVSLVLDARSKTQQNIELISLLRQREFLAVHISDQVGDAERANNRPVMSFLKRLSEDAKLAITHKHFLRQLEQFSFEKDQADRHGAEQDPCCAICLDSLEAGQQVAKPPCQHIFHKQCLKRWVSRLSIESKALHQFQGAQQLLCPMRCPSSAAKVTPRESQRQAEMESEQREEMPS